MKKEKSIIRKYIDGGIIIGAVVGAFTGYATASGALSDIDNLKRSVYGNGAKNSSISERLSGIEQNINDIRDDMKDIKGWLKP